MKTVLIIDDNPVITSIYRGKLAAEGLHTEVAVNGEDGLMMVDSCKPDVVLLDLMLPKVNGMDVLRRLRARAGCETLPVVVFSNSYSSEIMQQAWGFGATDVLHKSNTTPRNVVLALIRAIATRTPVESAPVTMAPERAAVETAASPESQLTALLQKFAGGDMSSGAELGRLLRGDVIGKHFAPPMVKLFTGLEVLLTMADQAVAGPARELCHDSVRAIARVCRQHLSAAEGGLLAPVAVTVTSAIRS
jgi:CheY-like chemotaxis protein